MVKFSKQSLLGIAVAAALAGCAVGPDYKQPSLELPSAWPAAPAGAAAAAAGDARWWTIYGDSKLNALVDEALRNNTDLVVAAARLAEAEAQLGSARSEQFPSAYGTAERNRNRNTGAGSFRQPGPLETTTNRVALNVSYEIDFWGKYRRTTEAARAELLASDAARDTVRISLASQVATSYFNLLALDQRLDATRLALNRSKESLDMQKVRFDAGVVSGFEYQQRAAEHEANLAQLPPVERDRAATERALAVLLGRSPRAVIDAQIERSQADAMAAGSNSNARVALTVPAGLPSDLMLRRPDLREAEQKLIASNARIGIARAAYFPSISLTGLFGSESASLSDLFTGPARIWRFAGNLTQPIWSAGSVSSQVAIAEARNQQALAQYRNTIANAFREVQDAVSAQAKAREVFDAESRRVAALNQSYALARLRFENGVASQLDVIDIERSLIAAELNRIEAERGFRVAVADLFRAMGGSNVMPAPKS